MLNGLPLFQREIKSFAINILWLASCHPTGGNNNQAVICAVHKNLSIYFGFLKCRYPFLS